MKKILFILTATAMISTLFIGCGNDNKEDNMASDISSTVSRVESKAENLLMPEDNVSSESH